MLKSEDNAALKPKRRKEDEPMSLENHDKRISVLEKLSENCDQQRSDTNNRLGHLEGRLDEHLVSNAKSQTDLAVSLTRLVVSVEGMADDLRGALAGSLLAVKHETIAQAVIWVGATIVTLGAGAWAVFQYGHGAGWFG